MGVNEVDKGMDWQVPQRYDGKDVYYSGGMRKNEEEKIFPFLDKFVDRWGWWGESSS